MKCFKKFFALLTFIFLLFASVEIAGAPRLLIKMPTRNRFAKFFNTLDIYYAKISQQIPYQFVISCDLDDPVMNSPEAIAKLNTYPNLSYYFSHNSSKIEACNKDIEKHSDFDIILLASDDMIPLVQDFDLIIAAWMIYIFPSYDGVLHFNDGFQQERLNTLPILGKKFYDRFGYIYYPEYRSFFCDTEMTDVSRMLNKAVYIDQVIIEHQHPSCGKAQYDELDMRNMPNLQHDQDIYLQRRAINFGLR